MRRLTFAIILLAGCAGAVPRAPAAKPAQGVRGRVIKLVGDFTMDPPTGRKVPMTVPVHVFRGRVQPFEAPNPKHPALIRILKTDKDGRCRIALPPGEYTMVAQLGDYMYLNNRMADGNWAIVVVRSGEWSDYVIENVLEATF